MEGYTWIGVVKPVDKLLSGFSAAFPPFYIMLGEAGVGMLNHISTLPLTSCFNLRGDMRGSQQGRKWRESLSLSCFSLLSSHGLQFISGSHDHHPNSTPFTVTVAVLMWQQQNQACGFPNI